MKNIILVFLLLPFFSNAQNHKPGERNLFDPKTIGEIRLTIPEKNWVDILDSMRLYGGSMLTGDAMVDGAHYSGIGIRFRGNNPNEVRLKRKPYHIQLDYSNPGQNHQGTTAIKLSHALRDPSMVREVLGYEIARKYMPAPEANYVKLFVNGENVGLYVNVESVDKAFLDKRAVPDGAPIFKAGVDIKGLPVAGCKQNINGALEYETDLACYRTNFTMESGFGWTELQELSRVLAQDPGNIGKLLDVDQTLWMHALNNVMVNLSSYTGNSLNYYLYKDTQGRWHPVLWDLNLCFGSYKNIGSGSDLESKELQKLDPLLHAENPLKPLISQLLKEPVFRKVYLSHVRQILLENFDSGWYEKRARELQALIVVPFSDDPHKAYTLSEFQASLTQTTGKKSKIPGIVELMSKRSRFLKTHPELTSLPSAISDISIRGRGQYEKERLTAFHVTVKADRFPKRILLYYRLKPGMPFAVVPMEEDITGDLPTGKKAFTASIETNYENSEMDFYFMVENAGAVAFYPENYMNQPKQVKLSDLNK